MKKRSISMFITTAMVLSMFAGTGTMAYADAGFTDVASDAYYADAVAWAVANDITSGTDSAHFSPDAITTRGQLVTFLWRANGSPEPTAASAAFKDVKSGSYCEKAVLWAAENGYVNGIDAAHFAPDQEVTRAQAVAILARMDGVKDNGSGAEGYTSCYSDVAADAYYADAVAWAVENNIVNGVGNGKFAPNDPCSRANIVTFLYRDLAGEDAGDADETETNVSVAALVDAGYSFSQSSWDSDEKVFRCEYVSEDHDSFYLVECTMTDEETERFSAIYMETEDETEADKQVAVLLDSLPGLTVTCMNSMIPSDDQFSIYVGRSIAELEAESFSRWNAWVNEAGYYEFLLYDDQYVLDFTTDTKADSEDIPEDVSGINAVTVSFYEFCM